MKRLLPGIVLFLPYTPLFAQGAASTPQLLFNGIDREWVNKQAGETRFTTNAYSSPQLVTRFAKKAQACLNNRQVDRAMVCNRLKKQYKQEAAGKTQLPYLANHLFFI